MEMLEELENSAQRSVAAEIESSLESGACLIDDYGRERILEICKKIRNQAAKLSPKEKEIKLQAQFHKAATGQLPKLEVPRSEVPLSLFDWQVWSQARPNLWRYGDGGNLDPKRENYPLLTHEWISCLCLREEMEYDLETDTIPYRVRGDDANEPEVNRFARDWITLHLFATIYYLTERHQSAFAFLKNGGMKWAEKVRQLTPESLAQAARLHVGGGGVQALVANKNVPQVVREALNAMQMAFADVIGTDGHRRLCRHEGMANMILFGSPVVFTTPNLADSKQPLLLVVEGEEIRLDNLEEDSATLPKYRDMMQRLARDPVGQTVVFELMMRLFFLHVLGVRPECLQNRRRAKPATPREFCTDGVAASSTAPGIFGPVLAFRGEIEAQGRGSLHPHILIWLVCMTSRKLLRLLCREPAQLKTRLRQWMKACVASMESVCQSSVQALPRQFGDLETRLSPLPFSTTERAMTKFDGGSELETLREEAARSVELTYEQQEFLDNESDDVWRRPDLAVRDRSGAEIKGEEGKEPARVSVYGKRLGEFAVSQCPSYRRLRVLKQHLLTSSSDEGGDPEVMDSATWKDLFFEDALKLAREILVHICGESCFKYSGAKVQHICATILARDDI